MDPVVLLELGAHDFTDERAVGQEIFGAKEQRSSADLPLRFEPVPVVTGFEAVPFPRSPEVPAAPCPQE